jgi:excisionase family DNA binding protein
MTAPKMLTTTGAARILGYSDDKVRRLCEAGAFANAIRDGYAGHWRIPLTDVDAWIAARKVACTPVRRRVQ